MLREFSSGNLPLTASIAPSLIFLKGQDMNDMCPVCRTVRDLDAKKKTVSLKAPKGTALKVQVIDYFCSTCGVFVKSEESKIKRDKKAAKPVRKKK
jgi:hypothetical protein